jgi:Domain of unknown function (DUF1996)
MFLPTRSKDHVVVRRPGLIGIGIGMLTLALAGFVSAEALARGMSMNRERRPPVSLQDLVGVEFFHDCRFTHEAPDDPIVFPGKSGISHLHTFVGNRTTNAFSTYASLRSGGTTCARTADRSAYWAPALYRGSKLILPTLATVYYRRFTLAPVHPFPNGLRMIAGNSRATSVQGTRVTFWHCGVLSSVRRSTHMLTCPRREFLHLTVMFPECWDGRHLDSPDHQSHMAYMWKGKCPASHPVPVPALATLFSYPVRGGSGLLLSSGGLYSGHADFINAWDPEALRKLVDGCLNEYVHALCRPPTLELRSLQPLTIRGINFVPRERVTLTLNAQHTQRVRANANAAFVITFRDATVNPCDRLIVKAIGSKGTVVTYRSRPRMCTRKSSG